jgi:hypothetical protein
MSWGAQNRSKDAKTPSAAHGRSKKPEPDSWSIQPYAAVVYKLHIAIDLIGNVVHFSGLHLGTIPDGVIWGSTANKHPTERNKGCDDLITKNVPLASFESLR